MDDLDEYALHQLAFGKTYSAGGREYVIVPADLLRRVVDRFEVTETRDVITNRSKR